MPLASKVSDEKSADNLFEDHLYVTSHFSWCFEHSLSSFFKRLITKCLNVGLFKFILESVKLLDIYTHVSYQIGKFSAIITLNILSAPFSLSSLSGTPTMCMLVHLIIVPHVP